MVPGLPVAPTRGPQPRFNAPRTFEKRLRRKGRAPAAARSLTEGQQDAAEAQHPQDPHGAWPASRKSFSVSGAASTPPNPESKRLTPPAARSAH